MLLVPKAGIEKHHNTMYYMQNKNNISLRAPFYAPTEISPSSLCLINNHIT